MWRASIVPIPSPPACSPMSSKGSKVRPIGYHPSLRQDDPTWPRWLARSRASRRSPSLFHISSALLPRRGQSSGTLSSVSWPPRASPRSKSISASMTPDPMHAPHGSELSPSPQRVRKRGKRQVRRSQPGRYRCPPISLRSFVASWIMRGGEGSKLGETKAPDGLSKALSISSFVN